jgi:hypothetical protein
MRLSIAAACLGSVFAAACALVSCSSGGGGTAAPPAPAPVTFYKDVAPLVHDHCQKCHVQGGIAPFPLITYTDVATNGNDIVAQTSARTMPPWGAHEDTSCQPPFPWRNDPSLSDDQIKLLSDWVAGGMQAGDPADMPASAMQAIAPPAGLPNTSIELNPQQAYTVVDPSQDDFRCFVMDPKLTTTQYVNGSFVIPGNKTIVHHALVFTDPKGQSKAKAGPDGSYPCFSDPGVSGEQLVSAWAPGGDPLDFPSNVGMKVTPGTLFVMQVHYHPHSATASLAPDMTTLQIRYTQGTPDYFMLTGLVGNFSKPGQQAGLVPYANEDGSPDDQFVIPAGATSHVQVMQFTVPPIVNGMGLPSQVYLYGVAGHMHYVGTDIQISVHHATANDQPDACLLHIPKWNFNWQRFYEYDTNLENLPSVRPFDQLTITCRYDNSMENPFVRQALLDQGLSRPRDVHLGETTLDEMCLGGFALVYKPVQ